MHSDARRDYLLGLPVTTTAREAARSWCSRLRKVGSDSGTRLVAALRMRGFLAIQDPHAPSAALLSVSHVSDLGVLRRCSSITPLQSPRAWGWRIQGERLSTWLFPSTLDRPKGLTSVGFSAYVGSGWKSYQRMHHGARTAIAPLDIGVALLVRALPLIGIGTVWSCDGHARAPARVELATRWDAIWLQLALDDIWDRCFSTFGGPACRWNVDTLRAELTIRPMETGGGARLLHDILAVAETIMVPEVHSSLRRARAAALDCFKSGTAPSPSAWRESLVAALNVRRAEVGATSVFAGPQLCLFSLRTNDRLT